MIDNFKIYMQNLGKKYNDETDIALSQSNNQLRVSSETDKHLLVHMDSDVLNERLSCDPPEHECIPAFIEEAAPSSDSENQTVLIPLHNHSHYSVGDAMTTIDEMVNFAKVNKLPAIAITDHGNTLAYPEFLEKCKREGIKPIFGIEAYLEINGENTHLLLLAKNHTGYQNIIAMIEKSEKSMKNGCFKSVFTIDTLENHSSGLIAFSACRSGIIPKRILEGNIQKAIDLSNRFNTIFKNDFYLELIFDGTNEQRVVNEGLMIIHGETKIPLVVTTDAHYLKPEDCVIRDIIRADKYKKKETDSEYKDKSGEYYLKTASEILSENIYGINQSILQEAMKTTVEIANSCELIDIFSNKAELPKGINPSDKKEFEILKEIALRGLKEKQLDKSQYLERLYHELSVIDAMGFIRYFLVVYDLISFMLKTGILYCARGSASGSLVCFSLNITQMDPVKHELFFERFLNSSRSKMPDIDIDVVADKRELVIEYLINKYGETNVSGLISSQRYKELSTVDAISRYFSISKDKIDVIKKALRSFKYCSDLSDDDLGEADDVEIGTLGEHLLYNENLNKILEADNLLNEQIRMAAKLQGETGRIRSITKHPSGILVSSIPISSIVPTVGIGDNENIKYALVNKDDAEKYGLIKLDILSSNYLNNLQSIVASIIKDTDETFKMNNIPEKFRFLDTVFYNPSGIFQVDTEIGLELFSKIKPETMEEFAIFYALVRPGARDNGCIETYIERKNHPDYIDTLPEVKEILSDTLGIILFQEQVMAILTKLAGFNMAEADLARTAISSKNPEKFRDFKEKFITGSITNGTSEPRAIEIFELLEKWANYGFNKAHAYAYARIGYYSLFLRENYTAQFAKELFGYEIIVNREKKRFSKLKRYFSNRGISIKYPDINSLSVRSFVDETGSMVIPAIVFSHLTTKVVDYINDKKGDNKFLSFEDFYQRCSTNGVTFNSKHIKALIKAGMFKGEDRLTLYNDYLIRNKINKESNSFNAKFWQKSLESIINEKDKNFVQTCFQSKSVTDLNYETMRELFEVLINCGYINEGVITKRDIRAYEIDQLGETDFELDTYREYQSESFSFDLEKNNDEFNEPVIIYDIDFAFDKHKRKMAFVTSGCAGKLIPLTVFNSLYSKNEKAFNIGAILHCKIKRQDYNGKIAYQIIAINKDLDDIEGN